MEIHISRNGQKFGPYKLDEVKNYIASGQLQANDMAWYQGAAGWIPLSELLASQGHIHGRPSSFETKNPQHPQAHGGLQPVSSPAKSNKKMWVILGVLVGVPTVLLGGCVAFLALVGSSVTNNPTTGSRTPSYSSTAPSVSPISVTALALAQAYEDNEVAADNMYSGKVLTVTGIVQSIDTIFGSTSVTLAGKEMSIVSVQCFVDDSQKGSVARLKKGQTVTVQGVGDGKSLNVHLKDCSIK
jgi:tRNA_anti-like/GYF domain 2